MLTEKSMELPREVRQGLVEVLTGGNHLASVLINRLGAGPENFPVYETPIEIAQELLVGDTWDIWIGWRSIMRLRNALKAVGMYE
jgi:hypothetical protein